MKNVDVEIYMNQLISFFDNNPNDLISVVGDENKKIFYEKIREQCFKNLENGEDISLTRNQFFKIVQEIKEQDIEQTTKVFNGVFMKTRFGDISLN